MGHPSAERLAEIVDANAESRESAEAAERKRRERDDRLKGLPLRQTMDSWCERCRVDLEAEMTLTGADGREHYGGRCPKGHKLVRYALERERDPYWHRSKKLKRIRHTMADDLLQPDSPRFWALYGHKYKKSD